VIDLDSVKEINRVDKRVLGNGIVYVKGITNEGEHIKGISLFFVNKQLLTFALADELWVDEYNKPYNFKLDGTVLFVKRLAIGFGKRGI